jgi:nuclear transport factor 2 (NTF2) superfamily protein
MEEESMPYDQSLDKELFKESKEFDGTRITVGVFQYNEGEKKLQMVRENRTQTDEWRFAKLGRMNKEEAKEVIPVMMKALEVM